MNVLVINCGSSSLKFQLINAESEEVLKKHRDCSLLQMHPEREYLQSRRLLKKKRKAHIRRRQR